MRQEPTCAADTVPLHAPIHHLRPFLSVNWKQGEDVIIAGSVTDDEARKIYPDGWKAPKPYLRIVPQPR